MDKIGADGNNTKIFELTSDKISYTNRLIAKKGQKVELIEEHGELALVKLGEEKFYISKSKIKKI